ncbi:inner centromere protein A [Senna tora]|uniref:Inner centromere protein A n=1 Tax=Senna tora TaxID=362788 RepID=A0A834XA42_9FABA|nr:inner centromere protein A [Senna tora]
MASIIKPSSRYSSYDSRSSTSSHFSDPSSSSDFKHNKSSSSRAIVKAKPSDLAQARSKSTKAEPSLTTMVKKLMEKKSAATKPKSGGSRTAGLLIPSDLIAEDLKKNARRTTGLSALQKKLFGKGPSAEKKKKEEVKALTEVKGNTRTLAMVLRSERELLSMNKEMEVEIAELKLRLEEKNKEVEKLKDLCLNQREEIKSLKSAILFPDVMNSQLQGLLEKQGSELKQAKQVIPALQKQVSSLTGQLQSLAEDLAEVKADKRSANSYLRGQCNSPRTPTHAHEDASNSWEFSSEDLTTARSLDDLLLKDLNPCLTPCNAKSRSREFEGIGCESFHDESLSEDDETQVYPVTDFSSYDRKLSKSSDCCQKSNQKNMTTKASRRSNESKVTYRSQMNHHKLL